MYIRRSNKSTKDFLVAFESLRIKIKHFQTENFAPERVNYFLSSSHMKNEIACN